MKIILFLSLFLSYSALAENLFDVWSFAFQNNPQIQANLSKMKLNDLNMNDATGQFLPKIDLFANLETAENDTDIKGNSDFSGNRSVKSDPIAYGASIEQTLFAGGANVANLAATRRQVQGANILASYQNSDILIEVASAYIDVVQAEKNIEFFKSSLDLIGTNYKMAKLKFKNGTTPKTDLLRTQARFEEAKAQYTKALGDYQISKQRYVWAVGKEPQKGMKIPVIKSFKVYKNESEFFEDVQNFNPQLKSLELNRKALENKALSKGGIFLPKVSAKGSYSESLNNSMIGMDMDTKEAKIGLYATYSLFNRGLDTNDLRRANREKDIALLEEKEGTAKIAVYAQQAWQNWVAYKEIVKSNNEKVKALKTALNGIQLEAKLGRKSFVDVLQTQEEYISAQMSLLVAEKNEVVSYLQTLQLTGFMNLEDLKKLKYD